MRELLRTYRLLIAVAVLGLFGLVSPILAYFTPQLVERLGPEFGALVPAPTMVDALVQYQKNLVQFGALLAILLGMGSITREKESGTAGMLLSKPVSRFEFLLAKLAAQVMTFAFAIALAAVGCYLYTWLFFEAPRIWSFIAMNLLLASFLTFYVAVAVSASAVAPSTTVAGALALAVLIVLSILGSLPAVRPYAPNAILDWASSVVSGGAHSQWPALAISFALGAIVWLATWAAFRRQEL